MGIWGFFLMGNHDPEPWYTPLASPKRDGTNGDYLSGLLRAVLWIPSPWVWGLWVLSISICPLSPILPAWPNHPGPILCSWTLTSVGNYKEKLILGLIRSINIKQLAEHCLKTQMIWEISSVSKITEKPQKELRLYFQNWRSAENRDEKSNREESSNLCFSITRNKFSRRPPPELLGSPQTHSAVLGHFKVISPERQSQVSV